MYHSYTVIFKLLFRPLSTVHLPVASARWISFAKLRRRAIKAAMRFLRRHAYFLLSLAVFFCSGILVLWQFRANESAHTRRVEDFILICEEGDAHTRDRLYQQLIQELPDLSDRALVADFTHTGILISSKAADQESLLWKFHLSTKNELRMRAERRLSRVRDQTEKP